jgi:hypothetical protein
MTQSFDLRADTDCRTELLHDLRVQVANHQGGQRSYVVLDVSTGVVHRRAERFLAGFGEGMQRTYAYRLGSPGVFEIDLAEASGRLRGAG